jgi:hypothetical protein
MKNLHSVSKPFYKQCLPLLLFPFRKKIMLLFLLFSGKAFSATYTFNGLFGVNWNNGWNWSTGMPPAVLPAGDVIIISANCTINVPVTINGTLNFTGTPAITNSSTLTIGATGMFNARTFINNNICTVNGGFSAAVALTNGAMITINSAVTTSCNFINNGNLTINSPGNLQFNNGSLSNNAVITVSVNGMLSMAGGSGLTNSGQITINAGATLNRTGSGGITNNVLALINNSGTLNQNSFNNFNNAGTINNLNGANLTINSGFFTNSGTFNNSTTGTLTISSSASFTNGANMNNAGTIKCSGFYSHNANYNGFAGSKISPGSSNTGNFILTGSQPVFNMGNTTYQCDIGGTTQGVTYDRLSVNNNVTITNANLVVTWSSFTPVAGQSFTIMTFGSRTGQFASVTIPPVPGVGFTVQYNAASVVLLAHFPLPLHLLGFSGKINGDKAELEWKTENEENSSHFEIERSGNGNSFIKTGTVASLNTPGLHQYTYTDAQPLQGTNYYRLKQIDIDGKFNYSKIIVLNFEASRQIRFYPNPVMDVMHFNLSSAEPGFVIIVNSKGQIVKREQLSSTATTINMSGLAKGIYTVKIMQGEKQSVAKLVKQ